MIRFHPDAEDRALVDAFDRPFSDLLPLARLHATDQDDEATWSAIADLGVLGIAVPEHCGGAGLGAVIECLVAARAGRQLASPSFFATMAAVHLVANGEDAERVATGTLRFAPCWSDGDTFVVAEGSSADGYLMRTADSIALVLGSHDDAHTLLDGDHWLSSLARLTVRNTPLAMACGTTLLRVRLIDAAALVGIAQASLEMAIDYAKFRHQFGQPIGAFQAIKHGCADMAIRHRAAADQLGFAAVAIDDDRDNSALQVEAALVLAMEAALENSARNIQIHGGIGFSSEANPHLLIKRARLLVTIAGGLEAALTRMADARAAF